MDGKSRDAFCQTRRKRNYNSRLGVNIEYKNHVTFDDTIIIRPFVKEYNGVRLAVGYDVTNKANGKTAIIGETKHCFTSKDLRPVNLKKVAPDYSEKFANL